MNIINSFYSDARRSDFTSGEKDVLELSLTIWMMKNGIPYWIEDFIEKYSDKSDGYRTSLLMVNAYFRQLEPDSSEELMSHMVKCFEKLLDTYGRNYELFDALYNIMEKIEMNFSEDLHERYEKACEKHEVYLPEEYK
jgi:hypothetical protein